MPINSKDKGRRGEYLLRDIIRKMFDCKAERTPGSDAFKSMGRCGDILPKTLPPVLKPYIHEVKFEENCRVFAYIRQCQAGNTVSEEEYMAMNPNDLSKADWMIHYRTPAKLNIPENFITIIPTIELFGLLKELEDLRKESK